MYDEGLIFFDYETYLNQEKKHIPNLVCAYKICKSCLEFGEPQINCSLNCGSKIEFIDNNSFCKWLLSNEKYTCMAHNLKGYDGCFLLQYFLNAMVSFDQ